MLRFVTALLLACIFTMLVIACSGAPPLQTLALVLEGGAGSAGKLAQSLSVWVPLVICSSALLLTFACGLWNIGVEGQIVLGAVFAAGFFRFTGGSGGLPTIVLGLVAGMIGGALWASLSGVFARVGTCPRDILRSRVEFRGYEPVPLAHIRPVETAGNCFHERHGTHPGIAVAASTRQVAALPGESDTGSGCIPRCVCAHELHTLGSHP